MDGRHFNTHLDFKQPSLHTASTTSVMEKKCSRIMVSDGHTYQRWSLSPHLKDYHSHINSSVCLCVCVSTGYYSEGEYGSPDASQPRAPSFRLPPDPQAETAFGARPPLPRPDGPALSLAPLPGAPYEEQEEDEEEPWRPGPPFPPFTERGRGGGAGPRRVYESESTAAQHF